MRRKEDFSRDFSQGCLLVLLAVSIVWIGCKQSTTGETLPVPQNIVVTDGFEGLTVTWNAVSGAAVYEVRYGENNTVKTVEGTAYTIIGIADRDKDTLQIRVRAGNGGTWSAWSTPVTGSGAVYIAGVPEDKAVLSGWTAYEVGGSGTDDNTVIQTWLSQGSTGKDQSLLSGVVMVQWAAVQGAAGYNVYAAKFDKDDETLPTEPPPAVTASTDRLSYFVRDVAPGGGAVIWVQPKNDRGAGRMSDALTLELEDKRGVQTGASFAGLIERADYPKNLTAAVTGEGSVALSWNKSDRAVWYEVYYHDADITLTNPDTGADVPGGLIGDSTNEALARLVPYRSIPGLQDTAAPWNDKASRAGEVGKVYKIHSCETVVTGLDPAKSYVFWVRSLNHNGERGLAKTALIHPSLSGALPAPTNVQVKPVSPGGGGKLDVSWNAVAGADSYRVYFSKYPVPSLILQNVLVAADGETGEAPTAVTLEALEENTRYHVWVIAISGSKDSPFSEAAVGIPNKSDGTERVLVEKTAIWGEPLKNYVYVEVNNDDPRVALGYELETGEKFFDTVILFAANLRVRDCANAGTADKATHRCTKNGPHIHYNNNVLHILENRDKYIKPLQDAGIKVVLGLLGDHDNFIYHSLGAWPFEETCPWAGNTVGQQYHASWWRGDPKEYPLGPETREEFINELAAEIQKYGLDGFDIDDEWAYDSSVRGLSMAATTYRFKLDEDGNPDTSVNYNARIQAAVAKNWAEFIYLARQKLGEEAIISIYDYRHASSLGTASGNPDAVFIGKDGQPEPIKNVWNYATMGGYSMYGGLGNTDSMGGSNAQYSPFAIGFHLKRGSISYPTYLDSEPKYGYTLYYALISLKSQSANSFWKDESIANWISDRWGENFFGKKVVYEGPDYPKDWQ